MEENFSMEWKWNGRKLPAWNMEKLSSIPFQALPVTLRCHRNVKGAQGENVFEDLEAM